MSKVTSKVVKYGIFAILLAVLLAAGLAIWVVPGKAQKKINTDIFGIAIKGYDPVAYFNRLGKITGEERSVILPVFAAVCLILSMNLALLPRNHP